MVKVLLSSCSKVLLDYGGVIYCSDSSNAMKLAIIVMPLNKPLDFDMGQ